MKKFDLFLCFGFFLSVATFLPLAGQVGLPVAIGIRYLLASLLILRWLPDALSDIRLQGFTGWIAAYCLLAGMSSLWSSNVLASLYGFLDLAVVTIAAVSVGASHRAHEVVWMLALAGVVVLILSVVTWIAFPGTQIDEFGRTNLVGILGNTNELARQLIFCAVFCLVLAGRSPLYAVSGAVCVGLALGTGSAQAIIVGSVALFSLVGLRVIRGSGVHKLLVSVLIVVFFVFVGLLAWVSRGTILTLLGKDSTLTARVPIWQLVGDTLEGRWVQGFGYSNYWQDPFAASSVAMSSPQAVQQAHNSLLEVVTQMGLLGAVALTMVLLHGIVVGFRSLDLAPIGAAAFVVFLIAAITYSMTASLFARSPEQIYWVTLVALGVSVDTCRRSLAGRVAVV